jgi:nucleoside-diphosphate-sugar epimerase
MKKKCLIIGGLGYIGTVVAPYLVKNNKNLKITCLDNLIYKQKVSKKIKRNKKITILKFDLRKFRKIKKKFKNFDYVVILGGLVGDPITKKYNKLSKSINEKGLKNLINNLNGLNIKKVIFVSTCSNYGLSKTKRKLNEKSKLNPVSIYARSKIKIEKFLINKKNKVDFSATILRFATAFGLSPRMRFDLTVNEFTRDLYLKKNLKVYDKETSRPYCHVKDFARLINMILKTKIKKTHFQIFNAGGNSNNFSKENIVKHLKKFFKKTNIEYVSGDKDKRNYVVDFTKVKRVIKFSPKYSLNYGINEIIKNLKRKRFVNLNKYFDKLGNYKII